MDHATILYILCVHTTILSMDVCVLVWTILKCKNLIVWMLFVNKILKNTMIYDSIVKFSTKIYSSHTSHIIF